MRFVEVVRLVSGVVVVGFGLFLIGLSALTVTMAPRAERFLRGFASSALTHYTEQGLRLAVGASIVTFAGSMRYPALFHLFGWLILVSTAALLVIPWRWHNTFATVVMPPVFRHLRVFALGAFALGAFVLYSASRAVFS